MLDPMYENRGRNFRDEIKLLKAQRADAWLAKDRARTILKSRSRLRDRYRWLLWLGGDRAVYDSVVPLREEVRSHARRVREIGRRLRNVGKRIGEVVDEALSHDPEHKNLVRKIDEAKRVKESCTRAVAAISAARKRIKRASASGSSRDTAEVSKCVKTVLKHVADVDAQSDESVSSRYVKRLNIEFSGATADRSQFRAAAKALDDVTRSVTSILRSATREAKALDDKRRKRVKAERARFE